MDNLKLVEMNSFSADGADIGVSNYQPGLYFDDNITHGPLTIYNDIKQLAIELVTNCCGSEDPKNFLVEMVRNHDGYPSAFTWYEGKLVGILGVLDGTKEGDERERLDEVWHAI